MRELPLKDLAWLKENAKVEVKHYFHYSYYTSEITVHLPEFSKLHHYDGELFNNTNVLYNSKTNELFKIDLSSNKCKSEILCGLFNGGLLRSIDSRKILSARDVSVNLSVDKYYVENEMYFPLYEILDEFYEIHDIDMSVISSAMRKNLNEYARSFLKDIMTQIRSYKNEAYEFINQEVQNDECSIKDIGNFKTAYDEFKDLIVKRLEEKIDKLHIKHLMLSGETKFSGSYKVLLHNYSDNQKKNVFDLVEIQISMMDNYNENLNFIKTNPDKVHEMLTKIMEHHSKLKNYINYLNLYKLTLTRDNMLIANLCFKDRLVELCK